jgi:site-specific DNA-methyltransferase (cytosine-N4-specific)
VVLNVSNDIFMPGSPARSLYRERLVIALCDKLGLHKMDETIWMVQNKAPAPVQWASKHRYQLNTAYEPIYWFCNDPSHVRSDNRRVLEPHNGRHKKLMARGGETRDVVFADGAYRIRPGDFGATTSGRIPRNVLVQSHNCADKNTTRKTVRAMGLPAHSAVMPIACAKFYIEFLTEPGELVVDQYGGWFTTAKAAEIIGRRWLSTECMLEYARGGAERFRSSPGFWLNPALTVG